MQSTKTPRAHDRVRPRRLALRALAGLSALLLAACQNGPSAASLGRTTATAGTIALTTSGKRFVLISEAMLETIGIDGASAEERTRNFYSTQRDDAAAKVAPNDAVAGLVQYYEQNGFSTWATPGEFAGSAPSHLTVTIDGETRSMAQPTGTSADPAQLTQYIEFVRGTLEVYNAILGRQNVDGVTEFRKPELSDRLMRETGGVGLGGN